MAGEDRLQFSDQDLLRFGLRPADEGPHPFDPQVEWWNESWFWDWFNADGSLAGHCRLGVHPNQDRFWIWLFLHHDGEWIAIEQTRLPLADLEQSPTRLSYDRFGLAFSWDVDQPLRSGHFRMQGFGRVMSGPRNGMILAMGADLRIDALGPPHSPGRAAAAGHESQGYAASRLEQPIALEGALAIDGESFPFVGRGERDHSWGPRHWNLEWTFMVLNGESLRLQCAVAEIANVGRFPGGYVHRDDVRQLTEVDFDVQVLDQTVLRPVTGKFALRDERGGELRGEIESLGGVEIDITHTFVPPERSLYRRALIRARVDGQSEPMMGWLEANRFLGHRKK